MEELFQLATSVTLRGPGHSPITRCFFRLMRSGSIARAGGIPDQLGDRQLPGFLDALRSQRRQRRRDPRVAGSGGSAVGFAAAGALTVVEHERCE